MRKCLTNFCKNVTNLLDSDEVSLDKDHIDLQLYCLDKDLSDSRQKANNWNLFKTLADFNQLKANTFLKRFSQHFMYLDNCS